MALVGEVPQKITRSLSEHKQTLVPVVDFAMVSNTVFDDKFRDGTWTPLRIPLLSAEGSSMQVPQLFVDGKAATSRTHDLFARKLHRRVCVPGAKDLTPTSPGARDLTPRKLISELSDSDLTRCLH